MSDLLNIKCARCGTDMQIHQPYLLRTDNGFVSQITLIPSWSVDERICPACGSINSPILPQELALGWAAFEAPKQLEQNRIIKPGALPLNLQEKLKAVK
jgi:hypothetical protein